MSEINDHEGGTRSALHTNSSTEARFRIQGAKLDAEEKLIALSEHGASVASWLRSHSGSCLKLAGGAVTKSYLKTSFNGNRRETVKNSETAGLVGLLNLLLNFTLKINTAIE